MAMTTEELMDRLRLEDASDAMTTLEDIIDSMHYTPPEQMSARMKQAADELNSIAVALCIIVPEGE